MHRCFLFLFLTVVVVGSVVVAVVCAKLFAYVAGFFGWCGSGGSGGSDIVCCGCGVHSCIVL